MNTKFNTGEVVYIPATITEAFSKENKIYYRIKESNHVIEEDICRTNEEIVDYQVAKAIVHLKTDNSELYNAFQKAHQLEVELKKVSSLINELASKDLEIKVTPVIV
ncbi:MAG: hypothetical protein IJQ88_10000 [Clostridia bacterium]|nr:hypothetical protein [Clostridia bacterium]